MAAVVHIVEIQFVGADISVNLHLQIFIVFLYYFVGLSVLSSTLVLGIYCADLILSGFLLRPLELQEVYLNKVQR